MPRNGVLHGRPGQPFYVRLIHFDYTHFLNSSVILILGVNTSHRQRLLNGGQTISANPRLFLANSLIGR